MDDQIKEIMAAKYVLWRDNGYEGWSPATFDSEEALLDAIHTDMHGSFVVTRPVKLTITGDGDQDG